MTPDQLRDLLARHSVSQRELARRLKCNPSTVFRWCKGDRQVDPIAEIAIHAVLGLDKPS